MKNMERIAFASRAFKVNGTKQILMNLVLAVAFIASHQALMAAGPAPVNLGSAAQFAILSESGITTTGGGIITGNVGTSPAAGSYEIDLVPADVIGTIYAVDATGPAGSVPDPTLLTTAIGDFTAAYIDAAGRAGTATAPVTVNPGAAGNIGGLTLAPGLYKFTTSPASITGSDLTLMGTGGSNDVWIFQVAAGLTVGNSIQVILAGGAQAGNIFWQVGTLASIGTSAVFNGTIMAGTAVTMASTSTMTGRALAGTAVTFDGSSISVPTSEAPIGVQGSLQVTIAPSVAVSAGALWQVDGGPDQNSGAILTDVSAGNYTVSFTPISGWITPSNQTIMITNGATTIATGLYIPSNIPSNTPPDGLILLTNGYGTIQHAAWPTPLVIGKTYKVTAVPKAKNVFAGWVGGTNQPYSVLSLSAGYTFTMQSNLVLEANFVTNVFLAAQGTYRGLFTPTTSARQQTNSGSFLFSVTSTRAVSGHLDLGGQTVPLSGKFDLGGTTNIVSKPVHGIPSLTITLQLDFADQSVSGTVSNDTFTAELNGDRDVFSSSQKATNFEGQYTLIIPGTTNTNAGPFGVSYGTVKVSALGTITLAGSLADGTAISQSSVVSKDGLWPMYVSLYGGKGSLWGWNYFNFTNNTITNAAALSWINETNSSRKAVYRSGFTNQDVTLAGGLYVSTNTLPTNLTAILKGGDLPFAITNGVTLSTSDKITLTNALDETNKLKLTISKSTGVISGSFANPVEPRQTIKVNGVILQLQGQTNAQGYFLGTNQSGAFTLDPP